MTIILACILSRLSNPSNSPNGETQVQKAVVIVIKKKKHKKCHIFKKIVMFSNVIEL